MPAPTKRQLSLFEATAPKKQKVESSGNAESLGQSETLGSTHPPTSKSVIIDKIKQVFGIEANEESPADLLLSLCIASDRVKSELKEFIRDKSFVKTQSLVPLDAFLRLGRNASQWDTHDPDIDGYWDDLATKLVNLSQGKVELKHLSKTSGPLFAGLTFMWHYNTWRTKKPEWGFSMDPTNPCMKLQVDKIGIPGEVRTQDMYVIRHAFEKDGVQWSSEFDNFAEMEKLMEGYNMELFKLTRFAVVLGKENFDKVQRLLRQDPSVIVESIGIDLSLKVYGENPFFLIVRDRGSKTVKQLVFFSFHLQYFMYSPQAKHGYYHDFLWNAVCQLSDIGIEKEELFGRRCRDNKQQNDEFFDLLSTVPMTVPQAPVLKALDPNVRTRTSAFTNPPKKADKASGLKSYFSPIAKDEAPATLPKAAAPKADTSGANKPATPSTAKGFQGLQNYFLPVDKDRSATLPPTNLKPQTFVGKSPVAPGASYLDSTPPSGKEPVAGVEDELFETLVHPLYEIPVSQQFSLAIEEVWRERQDGISMPYDQAANLFGLTISKHPEWAEGIKQRMAEGKSLALQVRDLLVPKGLNIWQTPEFRKSGEVLANIEKYGEDCVGKRRSNMHIKGTDDYKASDSKQREMAGGLKGNVLGNITRQKPLLAKIKAYQDAYQVRQLLEQKNPSTRPPPGSRGQNVPTDADLKKRIDGLEKELKESKDDKNRAVSKFLWNHCVFYDAKHPRGLRWDGDGGPPLPDPDPYANRPHPAVKVRGEFRSDERKAFA